MRRRIVSLVAALGLLAAIGGSTAVAADPTCSDVDFLGGIEVHAQHVIRDYVSGGALEGWPPKGGIGGAIGGSGAALPGGPGPAFHFANGFAPGASFCNSQSAAPGFHVPG